jgi:hypothetical protein
MAAASAASLACWLYQRRQEVGFYSGLALVAVSICAVNLAHGMVELDEARPLLWSRLALVFEVCLPGSILYTGLRLLPSDSSQDSSTWRWGIRVITLLGLATAWLVLSGEVLIVDTTSSSDHSTVVVTEWSRVPYGLIVIVAALAVAQLEVVFRSSRALTRYRLKLILLGLGGLEGYQIYHASAMLLLPMRRPEHIFLFSVISVMSLGLLILGLVRSRFKELLFHTPVSQQGLLGSLSFVIVGGYLLLVGGVGAWLRRMGQPLGDELSVVVGFAAVVALVVVASSKTTRNEIRRFVARNFYRPKYDYRAEWLRVTESFQSATTREAILDCLHDLLVKTFATTAIAVWALREADQRYCQVRPADPAIMAIDGDHWIVQRLANGIDPVTLDQQEGDANDPFIKLGAQVCAPIHVHNRLIAFIILGQQPHGEPYGVDDHDLLRGICHHVGVLFAHAALMEEKQASAELEALHRFSVFCLHDIKNLAARLSLVAQNAERHGKDPAFQESALKTVADTAKKMTDLISKLSRQSVSLSAKDHEELIPLRSLIEEVVAPLRSDQRIVLDVHGHLDVSVTGVREQLQQVLSNIVLNARQAIDEGGTIEIVMAQANDRVLITVRDTGRGIPASMLNHLFRPSQSSRPGGLGIGLYQCRKIVEAHGGSIRLESQEGEGTEVQIELPADFSGMAQQRVPFSVRSR